MKKFGLEEAKNYLYVNAVVASFCTLINYRIFY